MYHICRLEGHFIFIFFEIFGPNHEECYKLPEMLMNQYSYNDDLLCVWFELNTSNGKRAIIPNPSFECFILCIISLVIFFINSLDVFGWYIWNPYISLTYSFIHVSAHMYISRISIKKIMDTSASKDIVRFKNYQFPLVASKYCWIILLGECCSTCLQWNSQ